MNRLIIELNKELNKLNLNCIIKKETNTLLHCYLHKLDDCVTNGVVCNYNNCFKFYVTYKKNDLVLMLENNALNSFAKHEKESFEMYNKIMEGVKK